MTEQTTSYEPVRVHVVADTTRDQAQPAPRRRKRAVTMQTVLLTPTNPVQLLLNENPNRVEAWVIGDGAGEYVLSRLETQANQNSLAANNANGTANGAFIPNKTGMTAPVPMHTTDPVWVSGTTGVLGLGNVRVSAIEILEE